MNPYDTLKVDKNATQAEIRKSYLELMEKYNPKEYLGDMYFAKRQLYKIQKAYNLLSNPKAKVKYDMKNLKHIESHKSPSDLYSNYYSRNQKTDINYADDWNSDSEDIWEDVSSEAWETSEINNNENNINPIEINNTANNNISHSDSEKISIFYIPISKKKALHILYFILAFFISYFVGLLFLEIVDFFNAMF